VVKWSSNKEEQKDASAYPSEPRRFKLAKDDKIRRSSDYRRIFETGARYRTAHVHIRIVRNALSTRRLGMAVGRKVGNACVRNRIKRKLREYFRLNREKIPAETDMVFIPLKGIDTLDAKQLYAELDRFFTTVCGFAEGIPPEA
jgi:ribonuclease P protein component